MDQSLREIENANWTPHIEHQSFAMISDGAGFEDQRDSLVYGHKEPGNFRMRNRQVFVVAELLLQDRDQTPVGSQHVAEPD